MSRADIPVIAIPTTVSHSDTPLTPIRRVAAVSFTTVQLSASILFAVADTTKGSVDCTPQVIAKLHELSLPPEGGTEGVKRLGGGEGRTRIYVACLSYLIVDYASFFEAEHRSHS